MKQFIAYTRYFFYIAFNWNLRLAIFIIRHEIRGEKKYGISTTGIDDLSASVAKDEREHASIYQPANYFIAEKLFNELDKNDLDGTFLDVGCGKGRILAMAAFYGFKEITGIDFSAQLCHEAIQQSFLIEEKIRQAEITIECVDARQFEIPAAVSVIFMFNPFDELVMADFMKQVQRTLHHNPRKIKILYANPVCRKQLLDAGFNEIFNFRKLTYLEGSVFINRF